MELITEKIRVYKGEKGKKQTPNGKWQDTAKCPYCESDAYFSMSITDGLRGRGKIKAYDEDGKEIHTDCKAIALYYCPKCAKFLTKNK